MNKDEEYQRFQASLKATSDDQLVEFVIKATAEFAMEIGEADHTEAFITLQILGEMVTELSFRMANGATPSINWDTMVPQHVQEAIKAIPR